MLDGRIVGGRNATIEELPYQLSLLSEGSHICGAVILSENRALTAAHCTYGGPPEPLSVRAGSTYLNQGGEIYQVLEYYSHPLYGTGPLDYDISVLFVETIKLGSGAQPIPLCKENEEVEVGALATVSGWGTLWTGGSLPITLQRVEVSKVSDSYCNSRYDSITPRMTCYGFEEGGKDSCQGDSGGPLVHDGVLVGLVSWGSGCARPNYPGVYTKISNSEIHRHIINYL
ncbi:hypothetical protein ILUMI_20738 [Ignelater luminosus]|uniref:Peptidase S1 domain-containing protein n=1 Tax=Ignelater luminosus TaxID=2038154 RepID=A0A8K0CDS9_IGNLU|nr:hypothetical protein ILUMI_20738 [Ignelater luminosus]